jgi:AraC-like DNA-binding protein
MKALPFKIPKPEQDALVFQIDNNSTFYSKLHQHEEIQISLIVEGEGTLIVGDSVNYYTKGDVLIIGGHLPHVFKSDISTFKNSQMLSLFFTETSFGNQFFNLEELKEVFSFFIKSKQGFKLASNIKIIKELFYSLQNASKLEKFILLLQVLKVCSKSKTKNLSSFLYEKKYSDTEGNRMRNIFEYTMNHFQSDISLNTIAEVANMTKNAFCKYFKRRTNKTYFQFLNELRIENSCKLLLKSRETSIASIAEQSGFNNISNFNRQFQIYKQQSPSMFRKGVL